LFITKKPRAALGAFGWHKASFGMLVFDDADRFGSFGNFQEVDAARYLIDIDGR
jgi:hypothetical protein